MHKLEEHSESAERRPPTIILTPRECRTNTLFCNVNKSKKNICVSAPWFGSAPKCNGFFLGPCYMKIRPVVFPKSCWQTNQRMDKPNQKHNLVGIFICELRRCWCRFLTLVTATFPLGPVVNFCGFEWMLRYWIACHNICRRHTHSGWIVCIFMIP